MSEHFSEPKSLERRVKVELDLSNYATKADLKSVTTVDTSNFAKIDKLDVNKLIPIPVDLSKLSDLIKNIVVKKMYIMLRSKILKI